MIKSDRLKLLWNDPKFREKHRISLLTRRPRGSLIEEKKEKAKRKALKQAIKERKKQARIERQNKKKIAQEYIEKSKETIYNNEWRTCLVCYQLKTINQITDKNLNICIDCRH